MHSNFADKKILVGLSGGVDSATCVHLLTAAGFAVEGAFICFSPAHHAMQPAAETAAKELGIPLHIINAEELFDETVALPFCRTYCAGKTPNPCILCNPLVKFNLLAQKATELGIACIATGHYARTVTKKGTVYLRTAASTSRDQSYMLYRLPQSILERLVLPLGEHEKSNVRHIAEAAALSAAAAPDSQEICFVPEGDYAAYVEGRGFKSPAGNFIAPNGTVAGPHKGLLHYTVGQRRGLGVALGKPAFVKEISPNGDIYLGFGGEEFAAGIELEDTFWAEGKPPENGTYTVKIRSMAAPAACAFQVQNGKATVLFAAPQRAPAPGQSAVLYSGGLVLGGGFITKNIRTAHF